MQGLEVFDDEIVKTGQFEQDLVKIGEFHITKKEYTELKVLCGFRKAQKVSATTVISSLIRQCTNTSEGNFMLIKR